MPGWVVLRNVLLPSALLVLAILLRMPSVDAQTLYGSLTGNVTDSTGAIVPGVAVTATSLETNWTAEAATNDSGVYLVRNLPVGRYQLRVSLAGFKEHVSEGVVVSVGNITRRDVTLQVGGVSESVVVQGNSTLMQTDVADVHADFNSRQLTSLPLNQFRNYQSLFNLVPGVAPAEFANAIADTPERSLISGANGTPGNANGTRIDGAPSVNINLSHHTVYVPPAETIEVVHISTGSFSPDQGFAAGSAINVITKSGTNELHGSGFWYHENSALNARNFFNFLDTDGDGKANEPPGRRHIWGGTLGGPMMRDRLFFFAGFEALQQGLGAVSTSTLPTEDQRRGDFSAFLPVSAGGSCSGGNCTVLYDPLTGNPDGSGRSPFPGNIIPENRLSSPALKMQSLLPMPNLAGPIGNYEVAGQQVMDRYNTDLRIDWYRNDRHRLWGKFSWMDATFIGQPRFGPGGGEAIGRGGAGEGLTDTRIYTFGHNWSLSPRFLTDGNLSLTDRDQEVVGFDTGLGDFGTDVLGIPGSNATAEQEKACQFQGRSVCTGQPAFVVPGFDRFGAAESWMPVFRYQNSFSLSQNFSWTNGNHELRFGYDGLKLMHDGSYVLSR